VKGDLPDVHISLANALNEQLAEQLDGISGEGGNAGAAATRKESALGPETGAHCGRDLQLETDRGERENGGGETPVLENVGLGVKAGEENGELQNGVAQNDLERSRVQRRGRPRKRWGKVGNRRKWKETGEGRGEAAAERTESRGRKRSGGSELGVGQTGDGENEKNVDGVCLPKRSRLAEGSYLAAAKGKSVPQSEGPRAVRGAKGPRKKSPRRRPGAGGQSPKMKRPCEDFVGRWGRRKWMMKGAASEWFNGKVIKGPRNPGLVKPTEKCYTMEYKAQDSAKGQPEYEKLTQTQIALAVAKYEAAVAAGECEREESSERGPGGQQWAIERTGTAVLQGVSSKGKTSPLRELKWQSGWSDQGT
jgi:hypothetical protein